MLAALARGWLRMEATPPWVLDDAFALVLVGPVWQELHERVFSQFPSHASARSSRRSALAAGTPRIG